MLIEGEREIHLVTWNESHFHQLYPIANNPKIAMNLRDSYPQPYTIHDARHWIEHNQKFNPAQNFAIEFEGKFGRSHRCQSGERRVANQHGIGFLGRRIFLGEGNCY